MVRFLRHYLLALQFFTRIPVTGRLAKWVGFSPAMLRASAAHFPGVGGLVGALVATMSWGLLQGLPRNTFTPLVVAVLGTVVSVLMTGGFHEDGLADVADGLGGSADRALALEIMKDSRIGAFGALALVLALQCKVSVLAVLGAHHAWWMVLSLFAAHVVSRTWPLLLIRLMPHVGDTAQSKSKPLADQISGMALWVGLLWCFSALALAAIAGGAPYFVALVSGLIVSFIGFLLMGRWLWSRLQGFTGDGLGATQQVCEIAFYLGIAVVL